jgi:hypothetical protein
MKKFSAAITYACHRRMKRCPRRYGDYDGRKTFKNDWLGEEYAMKKYSQLPFWPGLFSLFGISLFAQVYAQIPFTEIDSNFTTTTVIIPGSPFKHDLLFRAGDPVRTKSGQVAPAKENLDFIGYVPINGASENGYLFINHETIGHDPILGDGGGMTYFEVKKIGGKWTVVGDYLHVDFSGVGGTRANCGGTVTPKGTVMTAEEFPPSSNRELFDEGVRDTSDVVTPDGFTLRRYQNLGYMVEIDPAKGEIRKLFQMGRFSHEAAVIMPDRRTVYLTDDFDPAVFFKFVAHTPDDYAKGQLHAYKQSANGQSGAWLQLPMDMASLVNIRQVSISMGATLFQRHEWLTRANGKIHISETGNDAFNWDAPIAAGGVPARHLQDSFNVGGNNFKDPFGRILEFDPANGRMRVLLNGGPALRDPTKHFSNPDGLAAAYLNGKTYLVIHEDLNGLSQGRVPAHAEAARRYINEIYWLDLSISNPTVDDLQRFLIGPAGCETTGPQFTPDYGTFFVSIQHPERSNPAPFNRSAAIAVTGFSINPPTVVARDAHAAAPSAEYQLGQNYPNPLRSSAFDLETNVQYQLPKTSQVKLVIYSLLGQRVRTLVDKPQPAGLYAVRWDGKNDVGKNVANGVYLYRLETTSFVQVKKLVLAR